MLQSPDAVPQLQRVLLTAEAAQHLEQHTDAVAQLLAARRLYADRNLAGPIGGAAVSIARLADDRWRDNPKGGRFWGGNLDALIWGRCTLNWHHNRYQGAEYN